MQMENKTMTLTEMNYPLSKTFTKDDFDSATKLHQLLEMALNDLAIAEAHPMMQIDMETWFAPTSYTPDGVCRLCMAGAVMAASYGVAIDEDFMVSQYSAPVWNKMYAIDALRRGHVYAAKSFLNCYTAGQMALASDDDPTGLNRSIPIYGNPSFKPALYQLLEDLRGRDL